eukprot:CAMPEP_0204068866 /NCGR_PEP_ID=MMETSP0360-20130528/155990_1 /ASSEMBLY_ACC=CAM_ASM_000342 /TAXON_ID=268821 /ORGANISM="Scrippsiella Hangoei, Strain SHTV-5" /LENGTH=49 /DNA_ID= /DNA_START= /DNA_END= /DNA_ORIENTATION=
MGAMKSSRSRNLSTSIRSCLSSPALGPAAPPVPPLSAIARHASFRGRAR